MKLTKFQKPSRYINHELNALVKDESDLCFALAFPDLYEVGMSHIGLKILYELLNSIPGVSAERVFMPALDMAAYLKNSHISLRSLESHKPLADFDLIGFSLQYELSYTTVLEMLHLSSIPLYSEERLSASTPYPLIIAGGPCTANPLPMSPFIDIFFIGEAEEALVDLVLLLKGMRLDRSANRQDALNAIAMLEGFYVPVVHGRSKSIRRRFIEDLEDSPYPVRPIVPYMSVVHDRIAIEVSRGCPRGCRFCQAGMIYRPFRERSVERVLHIAEQSLRNTGYDTVSFASLSAGDYSCLHGLMREFNSRFSSRNIGISLPSLRVGSVSREMLRELKAVRKSGFTIAPEAATDRLRRVINKDFTNEDYETALKELFDAGWLNLKLYFMIGLPTERPEDIDAIPKMAHQALKTAKARIKRFVNVSVTVSPFIPKVHTPFQWCGQLPLGEINERLSYLRGKLADKRIKYKGHNPEMSLLEAAIARGDERCASLIKRAWQLGAVLDGWSEHFDFSLWLEASEETGIDISSYAEGRFEIDQSLPWSFVDTAIDASFLKDEYKHALCEKISPSCVSECSLCGIGCSAKSSFQTKVETKGDAPFSNTLVPNKSGDFSNKGSTQRSGQKIKVRSCFSKTDVLKNLSHLETTHTLIRALRRAEIDIAFSAGFHPTPIVSFSPPLNVGVSGLEEYFDMEVFIPFDIELTIERLNKTLPKGLMIHAMAVIPLQGPSLTSLIKRYDYLVTKGSSDDMARDGFLMDPLQVDKETILSECVLEIQKESGHSVRLSLIDTETKKARLSEAVKDIFAMDLAELEIARTAMYGYDKGWYKPL